MSSYRRRILIVDDNQTIHADFRKILCRKFNPDRSLESEALALFGDGAAVAADPGFDLDYASQGEEALALVSRARAEGQPYMMAFVDVRMPPGWDGVQTTGRLWAVDDRIQVVICTAYSDYSWEEMAAKLAHPDRFVILKKPFDVVEVQQLANAMTAKWQLREQLEERNHKLQESEKRYHVLTETMPGIVWSAGADGNVEYANQQLLGYCDLTLDQLRGWDWRQIVHPDDLTPAMRRWAESLQNGADYEVEYRLKRADGVYRWHLARATPMRHADGRIAQWIGTCTDIDDQKRAEAILLRTQGELELLVTQRTAELAEAHGRLEHLFRSSPAVIYSIRFRELGPRLTFVSENVLEMLGYASAEFTQDPDFWYNHLHPEDASGIAEARARPLETDRHPIEYRFRHQDGSYRWLRDDPRVLRDAQGAPVEIVGSCTDITERRKADETLRERIALQDRLAKIVATAPGVIFAFRLRPDGTSCFPYCSPAIETMFGIDPNELFEDSAPAFARIHADDLAQVRATIAESARTLSPWRTEFRVDHPQKGVLWVEGFSTPEPEAGLGILWHGFLSDISDRKKLQSDAAQRERQLNSFFTGATAGLALLDKDLRFIQINETLAEMNGASAADHIGRNVQEVVPGIAPTVVPMFEQVLATGKPALNLEVSGKTKRPPGHRRHWVESFFPIVGADGRPEGVGAIVVEITERKRAEEALKESEARFRSYIEHSPLAVLVANREGRYVDANPAALALLDYDAATLLAKSIPDIMLEEDREAAMRDFARLSTDGDLQGEYRLVARDGHAIWIHLRAVKVSDDRFMAFCQDITERKLAEEKLRLQTSALEAAANGIAITEPSGHIVWVNPAFTRLTGYSAAEVIGRTPALLKSGVHDRAFYESMWSTIRGGKAWQGEVVNRRKDGSQYREEMTITPVLDPDGQIRNFVAIKQDISQRKQIEAALAQERDLLQALMDNLPDFVYFKDAQSRYTRINKAHARYFGLGRPEEAIGKTDADFLPGHLARQALVDELRIITTGEVMLDRVEHLQTADGQVWVSSTKVPIRDREGRITGLVGVSRNTTERKRVEEELRAQRESIRALTDNAPDAIARIDRELRFVYANRVLEEFLGMPHDQIHGKTVSELVLQAGEEWDKAIRRVFETGETVTFEFQNECPAGQRFLEARLVPEHATYGGVLYVLAVIRDVTERKRQEQQRRTIESRYQTLFESAGDAIMTLGTGGFLDCNTATLKMFGCAGKSEFVSSHPGDVSPPFQPDGSDSKTAADRRIAEAFEHGVNRFEWMHRRRNGEDFPAEVSLTVSWVGDQRVIQATVRDLTEIKKAEKERQHMEVQLRQAQKLESIGQLAAGIAHEINTPTQYVGDNTRFLKDSFESISQVLQAYDLLLQAAKSNAVTPDLITKAEAAIAAGDLGYLFEQVPSAIKETLEGVERVTRIVRAMKEFSHPGSKEKAAADLNKAIETTVTVARNEWKYVADLELELDPNLPAVPCFVGEFNQCILNLVVNAAHAISDVVNQQPGSKGRITVRTRRDGDHVEVRVIDTGTGIPEAARPRIFEPFFTTKDVGKGTGQGLSIVYASIVKKHGGAVSFETETGKGTTFILQLPITPHAAGTESRNGQRPPALAAAATAETGS